MKELPEGQTHFADDATLEYIRMLEKEIAELEDFVALDDSMQADYIKMGKQLAQANETITRLEVELATTKENKKNGGE